jgi:hypothetical protein
MGILGFLAAALLGLPAPPAGGGDAVLLDNVRVHVIRTTADQVPSHKDAVVVPLEDSPSRKLGDAYWSSDRSAAPAQGAVVIIEPKPFEPPASAASPAAPTAPPKGLSFTKLFGNDHLEVFHGHMDEGTVEAFHTHVIDMVFVHLSGGKIEDTAEGKTKINTWKRGDVEFEAKGSSHSARNLGGAIDVVVVRLKS